MAKELAEAIAHSLGMGYDAEDARYYSYGSYLTMDGRIAVLELAAQTEQEALLLLKELKAEGQEGGIEQSREEVTGLGTKSTNRNFCDTGFGGGSPRRLATATVSVCLDTLVEWRGYLYARDDYGGLEDAERNDGIIKELSDIIAKAKE